MPRLDGRLAEWRQRGAGVRGVGVESRPASGQHGVVGGLQSSALVFQLAAKVRQRAEQHVALRLDHPPSQTRQLALSPAVLGQRPAERAVDCRSTTVKPLDARRQTRRDIVDATTLRHAARRRRRPTAIRTLLHRDKNCMQILLFFYSHEA